MADLSVGFVERDRPHERQVAPERHACSANGACVVQNRRPDEDGVDRRMFGHRRFRGFFLAARFLATRISAAISRAIHNWTKS